MVKWPGALRRFVPGAVATEASFTAKEAGVSLIVGLGNPGAQYRLTRHNLGFMVVDHLCERHGFTVQRNYRRALVGVWPCSSGSVLIAKPQTFMNASGESVAAIARFYHIKPAQIVVVCDDVSLPFGRIRIRQGGSEAGHNGLRSISQHLGTRDYPRLRVGVGQAPDRWSLVDYVLSAFNKSECDQLPSILDGSVDALETMVGEGVVAGMNRHNGDVKS